VGCWRSQKPILESFSVYTARGSDYESAGLKTLFHLVWGKGAFLRMVGEVPGSGPPDKYKPTYQLEGKSFEVWKDFWQNLFHSKDLKTEEIHKMTDVFVQNVSRDMGHVLDHALKVQKALKKAAESGQAPEAV
jgi:hypothetical protein